MIQLLTGQYDRWEKEEQENIECRAGMRGSSGDLTMVSFDTLFNEVAWRLMVMKDVEILEKLKKLKVEGEVFNQMVGSLYSNIKADEINEIIYDLKENYGIETKVWQCIPGRADFSYVDRLIERYEKS